MRYRPTSEITDETIAVAADAINLIRTLPPEDRLNAVVVIARLWTDFKEIREEIA